MGNGGQNDEKKEKKEERTLCVCPPCTLSGSISRDWSKLTRL